jgi:hypothetical protein
MNAKLHSRKTADHPSASASTREEDVICDGNCTAIGAHPSPAVLRLCSFAIKLFKQLQ